MKLPNIQSPWLRDSISMAILLLTVFSFRSSIASPYHVPSESMEPTILIGDRLIATQASYGLHIPFSKTYLSSRKTPQRGDIALFPSPVDKIQLIKRIVAIEGDRLAVRNGRLILNGKPIAWKLCEKTDNHEIYWETLGSKQYKVQLTPDKPNARNMQEIIIPPGHFFAMGDNRDNSGDSRFFGSVPNQTLDAKAWRIMYSIPQGKRWPHIHRAGKALNP